MSKKNTNPTEEIVEPVESVATEEAQKTTDVEVVSQEELVAQAEKKADEFKELAQRIQAEFDNFRKRNVDSIKNARFEGESGALLNLIPIIDTMEIALAMITDENTAKGVNLIYKQFMTVLEKYKVTEIPALNEDFNPEFHNAVMQVEDEENAGKVVEVLQKGYIREGKVLRYSMVKVAR